MQKERGAEGAVKAVPRKEPQKSTVASPLEGVEAAARHEHEGKKAFPLEMDKRAAREPCRHDER